MVPVLKNWIHRQALWLGAVVLVMAGTAAWRAADEPSSSPQWPSVLDQGEVAPFTAPALLPNGIIWQQNDTAPGLIYSSFHSTQPPVPIVSYPDVHPQEWQAAPALEDNVHLIWLEQDGRLRCALINSTGQTIRGPIELAQQARPGFSIVPHAGRLLVLWLDNTSRLVISELDEAGRPRPPFRPLSEAVQFVAADLDQTRTTLHLSWLESSSSDQWALRYQASPIDQLSSAVPITPVTLLTFSLAPTESLLSFSLGLDMEFVYLFWNTTQADQPDRERVYLWTFPLNQPDNGTLSEVLLPPPSPSPLRWARLVMRQQEQVILTLALRTSSGWRPSAAFFQGGQLLDFRVIAPHSATAGPPVAIVDESGSLQVAWSSLHGAIPHLLITGQKSESDVEDREEALIAGLVRLPLSFLWLFVPVGLIWISPRFTPLSLAFYVAAKLIWPADLFTSIPPLLATDRFPPAIVVGITVLFISAASGLIGYALSGYKQLSWLAFMLVDALLTWLIFGANMG